MLKKLSTFVLEEKRLDKKLKEIERMV